MLLENFPHLPLITFPMVRPLPGQTLTQKLCNLAWPTAMQPLLLS